MYHKAIYYWYDHGVYCFVSSCECSFYTDPEEAKRSEILKLKRRFMRDKKVASAFIAKTEAKRKVLREVLKFVFVVTIIIGMSTINSYSNQTNILLCKTIVSNCMLH